MRKIEVSLLRFKMKLWGYRVSIPELEAMARAHWLRCQPWSWPRTLRLSCPPRSARINVGSNKSLTVHPKLKPSEKMKEKAVSILWPSTLQCSKFRIQGYSPTYWVWDQPRLHEILGKRTKRKAGEKAQCLRALAALLEEPRFNSQHPMGSCL